QPLQRSGKYFTIMKVLPSGVYQYRFIVDGQWRYVPDLPWAHDDVGNVYNILDLQVILCGYCIVLLMMLLFSSFLAIWQTRVLHIVGVNLFEQVITMDEEYLHNSKFTILNQIDEEHSQKSVMQAYDLIHGELVSQVHY
ncbi:Snf1-related protein kinase regulatory subunit beta-2, partial [Thalictrum thalictroides]